MTGKKLDAEKIKPELIIHGFAKSLIEVTKVATFGAQKYAPDNWVQVEDGQKRYTNAMYRHLLAEAAGETRDPESELLHAAHAAWNALARLEFILNELKEDY